MNRGPFQGSAGRVDYFADLEARERDLDLQQKIENAPFHANEMYGFITNGLHCEYVKPFPDPGTLDQRLTKLIYRHLRDTKLTIVRRLFADIAINVDDREVLIDSAAHLLQSYEEKEVNYVDVFKKTVFRRDPNERVTHVMFDDVLTDIIIGFFKRKIFNGTQALIVMLGCIEFRKPIAMTAKKEHFLRLRIAKADYKGRKAAMTSLMTTIMSVDIAPDIYCLQALRPIENMLIDLLDRKKHLVPAIVSINEINRLPPKALGYMFKRFADAISDVQASFRPLAIIIELIGQTYMYPAITHPAFLLTSRWQLDNAGKLPSHIGLPHSTEAQAPQTFFQYILLKQPRLVIYEEDPNFKPLFVQSLRSVTEVISMLILEAMAAMEEPDCNMEEPLNQFNWQNISDVCAYTLTNGSAHFNTLLEMLHAQLTELKYRKARGELMRVLLQYVGVMVFSSVTKNIEYCIEFYPNLYNLYNLLYEDEPEHFNTGIGESLKVRFFAPAAIWLNLADRIEKEQKAHPETADSFLLPTKLVRYIEFIKDFLNGQKDIEEDFIAVIANSCTGQPDKFEKLFCSRILIQLETPIMTNMHRWPLPYEWEAGGGTAALKMTLLESLSFTACQQLFKYLKTRLEDTFNRNETPCPALMESLARMTYVGDTRGSIKCLSQLFIGLKETLSPYQLTIMSELFSPRLKVLSDTKIAPHMFIKAYDYMHPFVDSPSSQSLQSYAALEAHFIRMFQWASPHSFRYYPSVVAKIDKPKFTLKSSPKEFFTGQVMISPEVYGLFVMQYMRIHKMTSPPSFYASDWETADIAIMKHHSVPPAAKKWIPAKFLNMPVHEAPSEAWINTMMVQTTSDIDLFCARNDRYFFAMLEKFDPRIFVILFRIIFEEVNMTRSMDFPGFGYQILARVTARYLIMTTNTLVDYVIWSLIKLKQDADNYRAATNHLIKSINEFIFVDCFVTFDRFFFQLVTHPGDDTSVRVGLELVALLVEDNQYLDERLHKLAEFLPSYYQMSYSNSHKYFFGMREYYRRYPECTYLEMLNREQTVMEHIPVFYTNLIERMLPAVDVMFQKLIEHEMPAQVFSPLVKKFGFMYRYHPAPATFLYTTLYSMPPEVVRVDTVRELVREVALNSDRDHINKVNGIEKELRCAMLSECFLDHFNTSTSDEICKKLIDRVNRASTYKHQPPGFAAKDFRFAELPPAAATLTGANIELIVSRHSANDIIDALYRCAFERPLDKPYDVLNAMALIVTTLPDHFQQYFIDKLDVFVMLPMLTKVDNPSIMLESFAREAFLASENQALSALSVMHAYFQHCSSNGFKLLIKKIKALVPMIKNEAQLIFMLRIIAPLIERCERDTEIVVSAALSMYEIIDNVLTLKGELLLEDTVSDLLYYVKYTFLGYSNKEDIENFVRRMPKSMREKLKYLQMGGSESVPAPKPPQEHAHRLLSSQQSQMLLHRSNTQMMMNYPVGQLPMPRHMMPPPGGRGVEAETVGPPIRVDMLPEYQPAMISSSEVPGGSHASMVPPHPQSGSNLAQSMPTMTAMLNQPPQNRPSYPTGGSGFRPTMNPPQPFHHQQAQQQQHHPHHHPGMMNPAYGSSSSSGMMHPGHGAHAHGLGSMMHPRFGPPMGYASGPGANQFGMMPPGLPGSMGSTPGNVPGMPPNVSMNAIPNQGGLVPGSGMPPQMMGAGSGNGFNFQPGPGAGPSMRPGMAPSYNMPPTGR